eukprot:12735539-Alexandrium_andersonii.AAC.1
MCCVSLRAALARLLPQECKDPTLSSRRTDVDIITSIIDDYHASPAVRDVKKWHMTTDEKEATMNFALRVDVDSQNLIRAHLDRFKWAESGNRWLSWLLMSPFLNHTAPLRLVCQAFNDAVFFL